MKRISIDNFAKLLHVLNHEKRCVFLDTSKPDKENDQSLLFLEPVDRLQCRRDMDLHRFSRQMREYLGRGYYLAGWIGYEFGYLLEENLSDLLSHHTTQESILADFGVYQKPYFFDHTSGESTLPLDGIQPLTDFDYTVSGVRPSQNRLDYLAKVERIKEYIAAGDTYQVNYTLKLLFNHTGSTEGFYKALRRNQSVAYGAYLKWDDERVLSFSPELFFAKKDGTITVKPMKGTMARGKTIEEDLVHRRFLGNDPKNRSENVMIVDLLRNDLSRLMHHLAGGEVRVESLFDVEVYETLLQMTSTIKGEITESSLEDLPPAELFSALFPCGSVTGAPKIRTMEIIDELEQDRRGVYTGAIGYLAPNGDAVFNVPIRTIVLNGEQAEMGIGAGIVHDSDPENEWRECLLKGRFLSRPAKEFLLIETFLWEPENGYWLLPDHLGRLQASADFFLFSCDRELVMRELKTTAKQFDHHPMRVRLTLAKDGQVQLSWVECDKLLVRRLPEQPGPITKELPKVELSKERVDHSSPYLFHKSTRREVFDREFKKAKDMGLFDICFLNKEDKLTEGCITNIFLYTHGGYVTPPVSSGLLAGVMRKQLLADKERNVEEKELTIEDVVGARAIFLCNSVRGVVQVRLANKSLIRS